MTDPRQAELLDPLTCDVVDLLDEHHGLLPPTVRWPALLRELVEVMVAYNMNRLCMTPGQAADDAAERVTVIGDYVGGRMLYLPRGDALRAAVRSELIYQLSDHLSVEALSRRFDLTTVRIYQILAEQRAIVIDRMQGKLFPTGTKDWTSGQ